MISQNTHGFSAGDVMTEFSGSGLLASGAVAGLAPGGQDLVDGWPHPVAGGAARVSSCCAEI
jgi:hypothetical protein